MAKVLRLFTIFLYGGFLYYVIELLWRGYSHPSMFIVGGLCFVLIGAINIFLPWDLGLVWQALIGAGTVTAVEFISGVILNIWLKWGVWDYSRMPFNVLGQACLLFTFLWVFLAAFGVWLDDYLRYKLFEEQKPKYKIF